MAQREMSFSVVIAAYNAQDVIGSCLESVVNQAGRETEIFVVDDSSPDKTTLMAERYCPRVSLMRSSFHSGAAAARNLAIRRARGEWVLTLDADAALKADFFESLAAFLANIRREDRLGIIAPRILSQDTASIYSAGIEMTFLRRFYDRGGGRKNTRRFDAEAPVFGACSATAVYRRQMLAELEKRDGFCFDERFFIMAEDVDVAWRARRLGWTARYAPACVSYHQGNGSRLNEDARRFFSIRNRWLMMKKNERLPYLCLAAACLLFYDILRCATLCFSGKGYVWFKAWRAARPIAKEQARGEIKAKKRGIFVGLVLSFGMLFFCLSAALEAVEERRTEDEEARAYNVTRVVKTVDGLSFLVQEDRPIEKVAGTYRPVDMDSYVALKFNKMEKKLQEIAEALSEKIERLERRLQDLEAKNRVLATPNPASLTPASASPQETPQKDSVNP